MIEIKELLPFDLNQAQGESLEEYLKEQPTPGLRACFTLSLTEEQQAKWPYTEPDHDPTMLFIYRKGDGFIVKPRENIRPSYQMH